jgi:hypothetical protein
MRAAFWLGVLIIRKPFTSFGADISCISPAKMTEAK